MKRVWKWAGFIVLLIFAVGQLPTAIGWNLFFLAVLAIPIPEFQNEIDYFLEQCSPRLFFVVLCLVSTIRQPIEVYGAAGRQMARFLYGIVNIFVPR